MARVMPASSPASQPSRNRPWASTSSTHRPSPASANERTSTRVWRCSGLGSADSDCSDLPMRPSSLRGPVAVTSTSALPCTTSVPDHT